MAFTRNWDENFPPDTQAANLLGQDIRDFKEDIRERVAAISGLLADRPAVGDMITGWGAYSGNGVLYFATDTSQIFRWSGAAWVDVTTDIVPPATLLGFDSAVLSADQTIIGAAQDVTGASVTLTTTGGSVVLTAVFTVYADGAPGSTHFVFSEDGVDGSILASVPTALGNLIVVSLPYSISSVYAPVAGPHTYKLRADSDAGVTGHIECGTVAPGILIAQEIDH